MYLIYGIAYAVIAVVIFFATGRWMTRGGSKIDNEQALGIVLMFGIFWPLGIVIVLVVFLYESADEGLWKIAQYFNKR